MTASYEHEQEPGRTSGLEPDADTAGAGWAGANSGADSDAPTQDPSAQDADASAAEADADATAEPDVDPDVERLLQQDLDELSVKAEKADEYLLLAQRTQADFENYRKRAAREAALAQDRGVARLAKELLPAIDNLDRALQSASEADAQIVDGVKLVYADLLAALARVGIEPFSPQGEVFDPTVHEAVAQQPIEGAQSGTVVEVFQQGYRLGESVLRPARVLVAA